MAARQRKVVVAGGSPDDYVSTIVVEVSERGECVLQALGQNICILFDAVRLAKEVLEGAGVKVNVSIEKLGITLRGDDKVPVVVVAVRSAPG